MGYRGFVEQREEARRLRAGAATLAEIAAALGVSRSTVSLWVRDVSSRPGRATVAPRANVAIRCSWPGSPRSRPCGPTALRRIGELSAKELLIAGTALVRGGGREDAMVGSSSRTATPGWCCSS